MLLQLGLGLFMLGFAAGVGCYAWDLQGLQFGMCSLASGAPWQVPIWLLAAGTTIAAAVVMMVFAVALLARNECAY